MRKRILFKLNSDKNLFNVVTTCILCISLSFSTADPETHLSQSIHHHDERLSLDFQDIEVRSALQILAEFNGSNLVVSDAVSGSLTLTLNQVPWGQALDIILKTKGLSKRKNGNILYISTNQEMSQQDKLTLQAKQQEQELVPLISQIIEIKYARATDLAALLKNGENTLLSNRGQVSVDERTNTLLLQDIETKLNEIKALVERLDAPVKQVLIESRIVVANDDFGRDLGARFGVFNTDDKHLANGKTTNVIGANLDALEPLTSGEAIPLKDTLNVDLPVPESRRAGQFALSFIKIPFGFAVNMELSAAQAESRAEVMSNPRVITANQSTARIETGSEIPYVSQTSSGATDVEFKKAVLSLEVTPQITPDNRVSMVVSITNDSIGDIFQGIPSINTNEVTSNVLVNNGQTIVLGGIYTEGSTTSTSKVPFFGDLPIAGKLFRNESKSNNKKELLIFMTPKIIDEQLNMVL